MLEEVTEQRSQLEMDKDKGENTQAPLVLNSKQVINNSENTMVAASPVPNTHDNTFIRWQMNRSSYA
jgi:hypothetical protein